MSAPVLDVTIRDLDLTVVRDRLAQRATVGREAANPPIPLDEIDAAIEDYRRYLHLRLVYPEARIVPSTAIGEVWDQHILFTGKYRHDCEVIFGVFLEHRPYFTRNDAAIERADVAGTRRLWIDVFGIVPTSYDDLTLPLTGWGSKLVSLVAG